ncbi:3'-5' exonuclease [Aurantimicrobium minutum]|uniref:3'-5' exonuclease n=1 Tax=Aurantimicrobium minutum TaxID=708131 RepID=UPI0024763FE9|nr:3'-5' exonuclease [Aurantimicrobium minutum]MDH6537136.1 DNA polymerase III epsilon subunit-like protein [Aurantimicrobium minutum]
MTNSFVAFDFETANKFRGSPCEIGLVRFVDGRVDGTLQTLLKPPPGHDHFDRFNIHLHGIDSAAVKDSPEFIEFMPEMLNFASGLPFVAHNAQFDSGVIRDTLDVYGTNWPDLQYFCTVVLSRRVLNLDNYKLPTVAAALDVQLGEHHKALDDALACGEVAAKLVSVGKAKSVPHLASKVNVQPGRMNKDSWEGCKRAGFEDYQPRYSQSSRQLSAPPTSHPKKRSKVAEWITVFVVTGALGNIPEIGGGAAFVSLSAGILLILTGKFDFSKIFGSKN